jgi:Domain of unknown function (DUF6908)
MRLVIEHIGEGPRGLPAIAVAHYYEQNGDAMRDPEIVFEVNPDAWKTGEWTPVSYRQDNLDIYQEAVFLVDTGKPTIRPKLLRHLKAFAREWDRDIEQQGSLNAARAQGGVKGPAPLRLSSRTTQLDAVIIDEQCQHDSQVQRVEGTDTAQA